MNELSFNSTTTGGIALRSFFQASRWWVKQIERKTVKTAWGLGKEGEGVVEPLPFSLPAVFCSPCSIFVARPLFPLVCTDRDPNGTKNFQKLYVNGNKPPVSLIVTRFILPFPCYFKQESPCNSQDFPSSFTKGVPEGFYWAFVSMTTIG